MKARGPIWLGLTERAYQPATVPDVRDIRRMVARTAYVQLRESPLLLAATVLGMGVVYLAPPLLASLAAGCRARSWALAAWAMMAVAYQPTLRFYGWFLVLGWPALPRHRLAYLLFTLDSARQHWRGRGGMWKGRTPGR